MGSGGMIVMDETSCMVDVAKYFMDFCMTTNRAASACPAASGTAQMHRAARRRSPQARRRRDDLALLEELCDDGASARASAASARARPTRCFSTLRYFRDEYLAHIVDRSLSGWAYRASSQMEAADDTA